MAQSPQACSSSSSTAAPALSGMPRPATLPHAPTRNIGIPVGRPVVLRSTSPHVQYTDEHITSSFEYVRSVVEIGKPVPAADGEPPPPTSVVVHPRTTKVTFRTARRTPRTGLLLVGLAGNNGTTVFGGVVANREGIVWQNKDGAQHPNYFGSLTQASTVKIGVDADGHDVHIPVKHILPMVDPSDLVIHGWDINGADMYAAMRRARVLDYDLQERLRSFTEGVRPMRGMYYPDFIAANQAGRADNVLPGADKAAHLDRIRADIREFRTRHSLETVIVVWTATTERFVDVREGLNMTSAEVLDAVRRSDPEVSPSQIYAVASLLEDCVFVNGSPQNTLVPGIVELARERGLFVAGDDFKSGQTKFKSVLMDFLVSAGIKVQAIASYNHLGNNDGANLSAPRQFRSKEISKSNVVDDVVAANHVLYTPGEHPDHCVVIKYLPFVADSKRALDEYESSIFLNGRNTIVVHNTCEDSLLASPLILDLAVLCELGTRIKYRIDDDEEWSTFEPEFSLVSYMCKAPLVKRGSPVVNALFKQQRSITNFLCVCAGIPIDADMTLESKLVLEHPKK